MVEKLTEHHVAKTRGGFEIHVQIRESLTAKLGVCGLSSRSGHSTPCIADCVGVGGYVKKHGS